MFTHFLGSDTSCKIAASFIWTYHQRPGLRDIHLLRPEFDNRHIEVTDLGFPAITLHDVDTYNHLVFTPMAMTIRIHKINKQANKHNTQRLEMGMRGLEARKNGGIFGGEKERQVFVPVDCNLKEGEHVCNVLLIQSVVWPTR